MTGPLAGVRVVELGVMIAGPAAGGLLADWGADVIKIEPVEGDPQRGMVDMSLFEMDNRGKRSITLDLRRPEALAAARALIARSEVFVTNQRASALKRLGLDYDSLAADMPHLVHCSISGFGARGEAADRPGYDVGAFWARSGIGHALTIADGLPPVPRPGMGDHTTGLAAAGGIAAALVAKERTGRGQSVEVSLLRAGSYVLSSDLNSTLHDSQRPAGLRRMMFNPMLGVYQSGDGQWFWLLGVQATRHWPALCRAIERPELAADPRFESMASLVSNRDEIMELLDGVFATKTMQEWSEIFAVHDVWWDPQLSFDQALADPLVRAAGVVRTKADGVGSTIASPIDFGDGTVEPQRYPELGEHTELVLQELGYDWEAIIAMKDAGALG